VTIGHNPAGLSPEVPDKLKAALAAFLLPDHWFGCSISKISANS